jgi:hypothetical protein
MAIRSVPLPTLDTMHPMAHPSSAHHLDLVTDPCNQRKLLPERVIVVRVLDTDVGERSIPWLEVLGELGKAASAGTSQAKSVGLFRLSAAPISKTYAQLSPHSCQPRSPRAASWSPRCWHDTFRTLIASVGVHPHFTAASVSTRLCSPSWIFGSLTSAMVMQACSRSVQERAWKPSKRASTASCCLRIARESYRDERVVKRLNRSPAMHTCTIVPSATPPKPHALSPEPSTPSTAFSQRSWRPRCLHHRA